MSPRNLGFAAAFVFAAALLIVGGEHLRFIFAQQNQPKPIEPVVSPTVSGAVAGASQSAFKRIDWTPYPEMTAHAALIADLETGETLMNVNPGLRWPAASLTKLAAAEALLDRLNPAEIITITSADMAVGGNALTRDLRVGESYRADSLFSLMLISSSNEAAEALARVYGRENLIMEMNARAMALGLRDTRFVDPTGISPENQTTGEEWKELVRHIKKSHPEVFSITRSPSLAITEENSGIRRTFLSTNNFSGIADFLGGKTGTTPESEENLLSLWNIKGRTVIIIVLGSSDRFLETSKLLEWFKHDFDSSN